MSIWKKILINISLVTTLLLGSAFLIIYFLFSEYREEEFQQRQKEKITNTFRLLADVRKIDDNIIKSLDRETINDLYDEKLLIFDQSKHLIYASIDDAAIPYSADILSSLSIKKPWLERKEGRYDVVGICINENSNTYFGISKAIDTFGYTKLDFLRNILIFTFSGITIVLVSVSFFIVRKITQPIVGITQKINSYNFDDAYSPIEYKDTKDEIAVLARQFNKFLKRMSEVISFQKHAIHHISHELKTPVAILVSNFERIEKETDPATLKALVNIQKEDTKSLSEIINSLLEIAKAESDDSLMRSRVRVDELIFDVTDELDKIYPDFQFSINYSRVEDENNLFILANTRLMKAALSNLMINSIQYNQEKKTLITLSNNADQLIIDIENNGPVITEEEKPFLFQHFFRGQSSVGKKGFGLGLVFVHKIITLHGGQISYSSVKDTTNIFRISLPLAPSEPS